MAGFAQRDIEVTGLNGDEAVVEFEPAFLWHPGLFHDGQNVALPGDGKYTLQMSLNPPTFYRHDQRNGERTAESATDTSEDVAVRTGQS